MSGLANNRLQRTALRAAAEARRPAEAPAGEIMTEKTSHTRSDLGPAGRAVATLLALVWLTAGALAIALGVRRGYWVAVVLGIVTILYGMLWTRVARTGRRLKWPTRRR